MSFIIRYGFEVEQKNTPEIIKELTKKKVVYKDYSLGITLGIKRVKNPGPLGSKYQGHTDSGNWEVNSFSRKDFTSTIKDLNDLYFRLDVPNIQSGSMIPFIWSNENAGCHIHISLNSLTVNKKTSKPSKEEFISYINNYYYLYNLSVIFNPVFLMTQNYNSPFRQKIKYFFQMAAPANVLMYPEFIRKYLSESSQHQFISPCYRIPESLDFMGLPWEYLFTHYCKKYKDSKDPFHNLYYDAMMELISKNKSKLIGNRLPSTIEFRSNENHYTWAGAVIDKIVHTLFKEIMSKMKFEKFIEKMEEFSIEKDFSLIMREGFLTKYNRYNDTLMALKLISPFILPFEFKSENFTVYKEYNSALHFCVHIMDQLAKHPPSRDFAQYQNIIKFMRFFPQWDPLKSGAIYKKCVINMNNLLWNPWILNLPDMQSILKARDFYDLNESLGIPNPEITEHPYNKRLKVPDEIIIHPPVFNLNMEKTKDILKDLR